VIGVAGVGVAGSFSVAAAGVAPVVVGAFFWVRWNQCQHFYEACFEIKIYLRFSIFLPLRIRFVGLGWSGCRRNMSNLAYRFSRRIKVMILVEMVSQGLGRHKRRVLATRKSAPKPPHVGHLVLYTKLFGLKAQCGPGARIESTGERRGAKLALK
jgi:hypothetical protein